MLIIPLTGKISWRNPPVVTIAIIVINCLVFFAFHFSDGVRYMDARRFYLDKLAAIEVPRYLEYLKDGKGESIPAFKGRDKDPKMAILAERMERDHAFMRKLRNDEIITPADPVYADWKDIRKTYEQRLSRIVSLRYGFVPAEKSLLTAFTHMFLHGGFMHLLGNMTFLWLVGCVLELGCGRAFYSLGYLAGGLMAVGFFWLTNMDSMAPLIGASGAISGLMGMYAVLYGRTRIRVFYSLGFYFNYVKVPAIVVLLGWIGNEAFQLAFGGESHIAYAAHLGGLLGGASLGYLNLKALGRVNHEVFQEDRSDEVASLIEEALDRIGRLDMKGARPLLERVLETDPDNLTALTHLFNIDKLNPENEAFHRTAERLLPRLIGDNAAPAAYDTYKEYCRLAKDLRLPSDVYARLSSLLSAEGYPEEAEKVLVALLKKSPKSQRVPTTMLNLSYSYRKKGMAEKARTCLRLISKRYPQTPESQIAARLLKGDTLHPANPDPA